MVKEFLQGRFMNHPLHPAIVHFPVGLWIASFVGDVIFKFSPNSPNASLVAAFAFYAIAGGLIGALLAVPPGIAEYVEIPQDTRPKRIATLHMILNLFAFTLYAINLYSRYKLEGSVPSQVTTGQFILSLLSVGIVGFSGFLGGLLVFDHGIGFRPQSRDAKHSEVKKVA